MSVENVKAQSSLSFYRLVARKFINHRLALISLIILCCLCSLSLLAPYIEGMLQVSHVKADLRKANLPIGYPHLLGTNELGQDMFTRLIYGGRISLAVGFLAAITSSLLGALIGLLAGYFGGRIDGILMRFTDAMLSIPVLPLMIVFAALDLHLLFAVSFGFQGMVYGVLLVVGIYMLLHFLLDDRQKKIQWHYIWHIGFDGLLVAVFILGCYLLFFKAIPWHSLGQGNFASVMKLILIIVFFGWMTVARLARASALQLKNMDFVMAASALGASHSRILCRHILPNALAPIIVTATLEVGANILYEAALSFLGLGVQPPVSSWGNMLNNAVEYIKSAPALAFWPGIFILLTVACFNFLGDGMRDALDPNQVMNRAKGN
jgi:peptide/nickel transport system permease protein